MNPSERSQSPDGYAAKNDPHGSTANVGRGRNQRGKNNLMALGSAAVLAVYFAGYFRTRSAALRFEGAAAAPRHSGAAAQIEALIVVPPQPAPNSAITPEKATPDVLPLLAAPSTPSPVALASQPTPALVEAVKSAPPVAVVAATAAVSPQSTAAAPVATPVAATQPEWKDGTFSGWGSCRHGDLQATVEIKAGRIVSAVVSICQTRYSSDVIDKIVPQVVQRQSADVDTVSGATQSADAFYWAVTSALASAKFSFEPPKAP